MQTHAEKLPFQDAFIVADSELCYLDGNSLGRLPKVASERVQQVLLDGWGEQLIAGWNNDWIDLPKRLGSKLATVLGCLANEVTIADSTSVNLFKLATAALRFQLQNPGRTKVLAEATNFPSDLYILNSAIESSGGTAELEIVGTEDQLVVETEAILDRIDGSTALVCLSHVAYKSGQLLDMITISKAARAAGALILWDLSHSVGAVPIELCKAGVDLAVGCTYKYLCGGPGAPAFAYCRKDLQCKLQNPIAGWFSHNAPFNFEVQYHPSESMDRFLTGTPPILSLSAIEAGIDLVNKAGSEQLRQRSIALSEQLLGALEPKMKSLGFELRSPRHPQKRGSHISIGHHEARRITENLIQRHNVIPDFRSPDNIRLGIAPLYTTESEVDRAADAILQTVELKEYERVAMPNSVVT